MSLSLWNRAGHARNPLKGFAEQRDLGIRLLDDSYEYARCAALVLVSGDQLERVEIAGSPDVD